MEIYADVIEFRMPTENNKTLFVWDIIPGFSEAYIYESLWDVFSEFGALYMVKVCPNAMVAQPGFYAIVKFFSVAQASKAQRATNGKVLFQKSPLKVRLCTKQNSVFSHNVKSLSASKCQELANHYLGFNGWSSRVVTLKDISSSADAGLAPPAATLKYGCIVELTFAHHGAGCRGVGVAEEVFERAPDPAELCAKRGQIRRWARDKAMADAFGKVLLVILGNGKVAVECKLDPDEILPEEDVDGLIKVNDISWSQFGGEEEELPSDLTLNVSHRP